MTRGKQMGIQKLQIGSILAIALSLSIVTFVTEWCHRVPRSQGYPNRIWRRSDGPSISMDCHDQINQKKSCVKDPGKSHKEGCPWPWGYPDINGWFLWGKIPMMDDLGIPPILGNLNRKNPHVKSHSNPTYSPWYLECSTQATVSRSLRHGRLPPVPPPAALQVPPPISPPPLERPHQVPIRPWPWHPQHQWPRRVRALIDAFLMTFSGLGKGWKTAPLRDFLCMVSEWQLDHFAESVTFGSNRDFCCHLDSNWN